MNNSVKRVALVYLFRGSAGATAFGNAFEMYPAGIEHDTIVVEKGDGQFGAHTLPAPARYMHVSDYGLSLCAFSKALRKFHTDYDYFCFLNSWSRPLVDGWLEKLVYAASAQNVGLAGATGSLESFDNPLFPPFPNPHIRLTGFCARTELLLKVWPRWLYGTKWMEHLHESGRWSVSRKCAALGLLNTVVTRSGYYSIAPAYWRHTNTFRSGAQFNLLVADNQTDHYNNSTQSKQVYLERKAWG